MKLKSFFANTIEEAIRLARHELGPDAMLVNSMRSGVEARHLGLYEVVVCSEGSGKVPDDAAPGREPAQERSPDLPRAGSRAVVPPLPVDKLSQDVSELKRRMEKLALTLARSGRGMASVAFAPELSRAFTALTDAELDTEFAYDVVGKLTSPIPDGALRAELGKLVSVDSELGPRGVASRVVALVGPPGAGKTSALVKLGVQCGLAAGKRVQVLTTDTYRIAAAEELRCYAAILGIGFQILETPSALAQALAEYRLRNDRQQKDDSRPKDLILIDTPGLSRYEMDTSEDWANVFTVHHPGIDTHLVLPASMRAADVRRVSEQYSIFHPDKLLFTRLDETETFGPILSLSVRMGLPISFLSRGQRIPEDLESATGDLLVDLILGAPTASESKFDVVAA